MIDTAVVLVNLSVPPQVRDDREVPAAAINFTREGLLAGMAVHVCL